MDDPPAAIWHKQNDDSLVLRLSYKNEHILLPADIEAEAEKFLLSEKVPLKSSILMVPHHGSRTSSSIPFIEAVLPRFAVISGRVSSPFHLPHPEVIRRYQERGIPLFRTDQEGATTFTLRNDRWKVESYLNGPIAGSQQ